eukprot:533009-Heterocapsa_arctica.AAC.1
MPVRSGLVLLGSLGLIEKHEWMCQDVGQRPCSQQGSAARNPGSPEWGASPDLSEPCVMFCVQCFDGGESLDAHGAAVVELTEETF